MKIEDLITARSQSVTSGTELAQQAGQTMREIVSSVQRVSAVIAEISTATSQQSDGIGLVSSAAADVDQATQQNAALVEQTNAAAASLSEQAMRLGRSVAVFRLQPVTSPTR